VVEKSVPLDDYEKLTISHAEIVAKYQKILQKDSNTLNIQKPKQDEVKFYKILY